MRATGNKGEWSELYALIRLLSAGELFTADEHANRLNDAAYPISKIIRDEADDRALEYVIKSEAGLIEVHINGRMVKCITRAELSRMSETLFSGIMNGGSRAFEIDCADSIMHALSCTKISAPDPSKSDIAMVLNDVHRGVNPICGFSIKSELGSAPTLLNASGATNFIYEVAGISDGQMEKINAIVTKSKIIDRISEILKCGSMRFVAAANSVSAGNMLLIDSHMDEILAFLLYDYYTAGISDCRALIERIEKINPLKYPRDGIYEFKLRKFLCAVALGMMPAKKWNGRDEANGGYVIVKRDGDVVAYHIYNRDAFEAYLLSNTHFEKASTKKHGFAKLYKYEHGRTLFNLNLQIRFT